MRTLRERPIELAELEALLRDATPIESDARGIKVATLPDGSLLKLFRARRFFSSASLYSYARRFARNVERLRAMGYRTVTVVDLMRVRGSAITAVRYQPVPGRSLRELIRSGEAAPELCRRAGEFIAALHDDGIYFRSLHMGNLIAMPDGQLGLIDVADMRFRRGPLSSSLRARNWAHLLRYADELRSTGWSWAEIFAAYGSAASLPPRQLDRIAARHTLLPRHR